MAIQLQLIMLLGAGLTQAEGQSLGTITGIAFICCVVALIAASLGGFGERSVAGVKVSLVLAVVCGLSFLLAQAFFAAGGVPQNIQVINGN